MWFPGNLRALLGRLQWQRGLRAALAVGAAVVLCRAFGQPYGWAALGGFEAILVDNGGPYCSRFDTILTVLLGGAVAGLLGSWVGRLIFVDAGAANGPGFGLVLLAALVSAAVCFAFTFARVLTQPLASTSVIILVIFFSGLGSGAYRFAAAAANVTSFVAGGLGAAVISLFLWPLDPFRPARQHVAAAYALLAEATLAAASARPPARHHNEHDWKRRLRALIEDARTALTRTAARAPTRTLRARNLTVLLETADLLFERAIRLSELSEMAREDDAAVLQSTVQWMGRCENAIAQAMRRRPPDAGASFAPRGSLRRQLLAPASAPEVRDSRTGNLLLHLRAERRAAREEIETAFDAVGTLWNGQEAGGGATDAIRHADPAEGVSSPGPTVNLMEKLRGEFSVRSLPFRHALRVAVVGAVDVLLLWAWHLEHGAWLGLTSIIVLQPYGSGTKRRAWQRVAGTVAGGVFAAGLAAGTHDPTSLLVVVSVCAGLTLACFAVDYGLYSFFLTPTFVLLSQPRLGDWRYAGVRIELTVLGAAVALLAMRGLWPEREQRELDHLLLAGARAVAAYVRAVLRLWQEPTPERRRLLAQARRACGLASNAAEETLDRLLLQPSFGRQPSREISQALTFTTYLRRLTQSVTAVASLGQPPSGPAGGNPSRLGAFADRLEALHLAPLPTGQERPPADLRPEASKDPAEGVGEWQMRRIERQIAVLERAAVL